MTSSLYSQANGKGRPGQVAAARQVLNEAAQLSYVLAVEEGMWGVSDPGSPTSRERLVRAGMFGAAGGLIGSSAFQVVSNASASAAPVLSTVGFALVAQVAIGVYDERLATALSPLTLEQMRAFELSVDEWRRCLPRASRSSAPIEATEVLMDSATWHNRKSAVVGALKQVGLRIPKPLGTSEENVFSDLHSRSNSTKGQSAFDNAKKLAEAVIEFDDAVSSNSDLGPAAEKLKLAMAERQEAVGMSEWHANNGVVDLAVTLSWSERRAHLAAELETLEPPQAIRDFSASF